MSERISHGLLDPWIMPLVPRVYRLLRLPRWLPPEAIVLAGHAVAMVGAAALALSTRWWWAGLVAAVAVAANHLTDMVDGTHARRTGQCRNGGELLDHFIDPLSFSYWMIGLGVACGRLGPALAAVIGIYATAVLTNIRAKMTGRFTLARFGPTEFKAALSLYGLALSAVAFRAGADAATTTTAIALTALAGLLILQLAVHLVRAVIEVNRRGAPPDTGEWKLKDADEHRSA